MPIEFVSGDLFDNAYDAQAFAHGCNCQGSMGAGIAKTFRARYPEMYDEYSRRCKAQPLYPIRDNEPCPIEKCPGLHGGDPVASPNQRQVGARTWT